MRKVWPSRLLVEVGDYRDVIAHNSRISEVTYSAEDVPPLVGQGVGGENEINLLDSSTRAGRS
jgi:hypothetical protein